ncbi:MAG: GspH/FimT family pseudopilin [Bermanella sp.]
MKKQTGLTLIELMAVTAILSIMVGFAVSGMKSLLDRQNLSVVGPIFEKTIKLARSEAVQRTQVVRITPSSGTNDWSQGWSINIVNGPNPGDLQLIRTFDALPGNTVFTSDTFDGSTPFDILPNGQASLPSRFTLSEEGCTNKIYTYDVLLSGILDRNVSPCP